MEKTEGRDAFRFMPMARAVVLSFCAACSRSDTDGSVSSMVESAMWVRL